MACAAQPGWGPGAGEKAFGETDEVIHTRGEKLVILRDAHFPTGAEHTLFSCQGPESSVAGTLTGSWSTNSEDLAGSILVPEIRLAGQYEGEAFDVTFTLGSQYVGPSLALWPKEGTQPVLPGDRQLNQVVATYDGVIVRHDGEGGDMSFAPESGCEKLSVPQQWVLECLMDPGAWDTDPETNQCVMMLPLGDVGVSQLRLEKYDQPHTWVAVVPELSQHFVRAGTTALEFDLCLRDGGPSERVKMMHPYGYLSELGNDTRRIAFETERAPLADGEYCASGFEVTGLQHRHMDIPTRLPAGGSMTLFVQGGLRVEDWLFNNCACPAAE